jgi:N-acetylmuramoyl-L-alanine amidase
MTCRGVFSRLLLCVPSVIFFPPAPQPDGQTLSLARPTFTVCIDPGHGGHDFGARGNFSFEKNITLAVGLKLGRLLDQTQPDVRVIYTRTDDVFIPLYERADIANRAKADLFISIHCNSSRDRIVKTLIGHRTVTRHGKKKRVPVYRVRRYHETSANGVETYVLRLGRLDEKTRSIENYEQTEGDSTIIIDSAQDVEQAENASIYQEKNYQAHYNGYDPGNPASFVLLALTSSAYQQQSIEFANMVQQSFLSSGRPSRDVKQLGLAVLGGSAMPSVLIETGFINNADEERYLNSVAGQDQIAASIAAAISKYKIQVHNWKNGDVTDTLAVLSGTRDRGMIRLAAQTGMKDPKGQYYSWMKTPRSLKHP